MTIHYRVAGNRLALSLLAFAALGVLSLFLIAGRAAPSRTPTAARTVNEAQVELTLTRAIRGCMEPQFRESTVTIVCGDENERVIVVRYPDGRTELTHVTPRSARPAVTPTLARGY